MKRTLRGRVSLLALAAIAALLLVVVIAFDVLLSAQLSGQIDDTVRLRAQAAAADVVVSDTGGVSVRESRSDGALDANIWVYAGSRVIDRPKDADRLGHVADTLAGRGRRFADGPDSARLYALPILHDGVQVATVVAATSTESYDHAQHLALIGSVVVALLLLAGSYPVLRLTASRALRPVATMTAAAADWSAHDPSQRFGTGQPYSELSTLAGTLDELLDRITAVMRHERHLAAELSHELRTPIARISAEADLLLGDPSLPRHQREGVVAIQTTSAAMNEIIETLLTAARADLTSAEGRCLLATVLAGVRIGDSSESMHVAVVPDDLAVGVTDEIVRRILAPILENARRFARSSITVTARRTAGKVGIDIANDGPPIPADLVEKIFEPGFRDESDPAHAGTGLGLALSRRLARAADGDVRAVPSDTGALLRVELPPG